MMIIAFCASRFRLPHMNSPVFRIGLALAFGFSLMLAGCGEKTAKVDLNAQVSKLSGDTDAKVDGLAQLATLGAEAAPAISQILPLLKDEDRIVRRTAAYALGSIGPAAKAAVPDLKQMLQTDDREQVTVVANALRSIEPEANTDLRLENVSN
jgi:HEAT repeat protein